MVTIWYSSGCRRRADAAAEQPPDERLAEPDGGGEEEAHQHADAQHRHHALAHAVRAPEYGQQREEQAHRAVLQDERADGDLAVQRLRAAARRPRP